MPPNSARDTVADKPEHVLVAAWRALPWQSWPALLWARSGAGASGPALTLLAAALVASTEGRVLECVALVGLFLCLPALQMGIRLPLLSVGGTSVCRRWWPRLHVLPGTESLGFGHRCIALKARAVGWGGCCFDAVYCSALGGQALCAEIQRGPRTLRLPRGGSCACHLHSARTGTTESSAQHPRAGPHLLLHEGARSPSADGCAPLCTSLKAVLLSSLVSQRFLPRCSSHPRRASPQGCAGDAGKTNHGKGALGRAGRVFLITADCQLLGSGKTRGTV